MTPFEKLELLEELFKTGIVNDKQLASIISGQYFDFKDNKLFYYDHTFSPEFNSREFLIIEII